MAREGPVEIAYVPFKTFLTALDTLRQGVPDPVDKSVFRNQSFSTQSMLISSLKALGALDDGGHPQPILAKLIAADSRKAALREVLESKYRAVIDLGNAASDKQFDDTFAAYGVGGDTRKKAKSFFLQAAGMVGLPLSPHIAGARTIVNAEGEPASAPVRANGPRRRRNRGETTPRRCCRRSACRGYTWKLENDPTLKRRGRGDPHRLHRPDGA